MKAEATHVDIERMVLKSCVAVLAVVLGVSSCASAPVSTSTAERGAEGPTEAQAARNRVRPFTEGMHAVGRYRESGEAADRREAMRYVEELEQMVSTFHTARIRRYEEEARDRHTELAFEFAGVALTHGHLDDSDRVYRRLIEFYVGNLYSGIRDRARLGVEDVRAKRSAAKPLR